MRVNGSGLSGFTMVELTAVASIIAILALILIPIVRNRVQDARIVAVQDDLFSLEKAMILANADTGQFFRLADLDNSSGDGSRLPNAFWNRPIPPGSILGLLDGASAWKGVYMSFGNKRGRAVAQLVADRPTMFRVFNGTSADGEGPILVMETSDSNVNDLLEGDVHPVDLWENPYLFFGPGPVGILAGNLPSSISGNESNFNLSVIYSLGPDNLPGKGRADIAENYYRETGFLGETGSDDIVRLF